MANIFAKYGPDNDALPTNVANGFLKRDSGNAAWEQAAYGGAGADVGTTAAAGTANTPSRSDHVHDLPESVLRSVITELTADPNFNARKLTNVADPTSAQDVATKNYADASAAGARDPKDSSRLATTAALPANTRTGNVLTASANGAIGSLDGVAVALNDRILVKNEVTGANNGIYKATDLGSAGTPWVLTRTTDADTDAEVTAGLFTYITEGTTNGDSGWLLTTNDPITLNTTALTFTQVSGLGQITAGGGLTKTGNTLDVGAGAGIQVNADSVEAIYGAASDMPLQDASGELAGTVDKAARTDHVHDYSMGLAGDVAAVGTANAAGTSNKFARADHGHDHGAQTTATHHAAATQSANGFMPSADKKKVDDILDETTTATATTTDATVTTVGSLSTADNKTYTVEASVCTRRTDVAGTGAGYKMTATFRRGVGVASIVQIGSTSVVSSHEDNAALDATIDSETTGGTIRIRVTGIAAQTYNWRSRLLATSV